MTIRMQSYKISADNTLESKKTVFGKLQFLLWISLFFISLNVHAQKDELNAQTIRTVCIDAGHGGKDPGCLGASSNEKTVCLNMALKLGEKIKSTYPNIKVVYTRDKDVFVELDERAKIANKNKSDLFICIHANAASSSAFGAETYVLGLHRTSAQEKIAERENSTIYLESDGGEKYKDFDLSPDAIIARQLQLAIYLDQSINFASKVQAELKGLGRYDRGVKQAGFLVLYKTTMPSVLIETGFLTNPDEEKFLRDTASQTKMANAMFVAFQKYKNELEGVDTMKGIHTDNHEVEADKNPKDGTASFNPNSVLFRVQIETSAKKLQPNVDRFRGLNIWEYSQDGLYKYTAGIFENDFKSANEFKNQMREKGFPYAFVVAFQNGERISIDHAIQLTK
ncbi:MAG: N-acetylmuramoyl-L-alanine amidase [Crocinitomicaceae bacterium]|nr:N-acetylmuramoyl-L-alanine amidase [Crocinitomicaceae bacterium]